MTGTKSSTVQSYITVSTALRACFIATASAMAIGTRHLSGKPSNVARRPLSYPMIQSTTLLSWSKSFAPAPCFREKIHGRSSRSPASAMLRNSRSDGAPGGNGGSRLHARPHRASLRVSCKPRLRRRKSVGVLQLSDSSTIGKLGGMET